MLNETTQENVPIPRKRLFVLTDGRFVIQWEENRVQDLLSGRYTQFGDADFGNAITDYELNQLKNSGIVAEYDEHLVYLQPDISTAVTTPGRTYYLNTTLHKSQVEAVNNTLERGEFDHKFSVRVQEIFVIIRGPSGTAFQDFDDAERAREILVEYDAELLGNTVVAFVEINPMS